MRATTWKRAAATACTAALAGGLAVPAAGQAPDAGEVLSAVVDAYGGQEALEALTAYRVEGDLVARSRGQSGSVVRIAEGAHRLKVLVHYPARVELRILEDGTGWRGDTPDRLQEVQGPLLDAMVLQAARANLPWTLLGRDDVSVEAAAEGAGWVVRAPLGPTLEIRAFVDAQTHRIVRSEGELRMGPQSMVFATEYSGFQEVDGILFALEEENFAAGTHTASVTLRFVQVNPEGDDLRLPTGG